MPHVHAFGQHMQSASHPATSHRAVPNDTAVLQARDAALIAEHAAKGVELQQTRQEREELEARGQVLQKVLDAKDACIAVLGATAQHSAQQAQQPAAALNELELQLELQPPLQPQQPAEPRMLEAPAAAPASLPRQQSGSDLAGPPLSDAVKEQLQRMSEFPVSIIAQTDLPPTAHPGTRYAHIYGCLHLPQKGVQLVCCRRMHANARPAACLQVALPHPPANGRLPHVPSLHLQMRRWRWPLRTRRAAAASRASTACKRWSRWGVGSVLTSGPIAAAALGGGGTPSWAPQLAQTLLRKQPVLFWWSAAVPAAAAATTRRRICLCCHAEGLC